VVKGQEHNSIEGGWGVSEAVSEGLRQVFPHRGLEAEGCGELACGLLLVV